MTMSLAALRAQCLPMAKAGGAVLWPGPHSPPCPDSSLPGQPTQRHPPPVLFTHCCLLPWDPLTCYSLHLEWPPLLVGLVIALLLQSLRECRFRQSLQPAEKMGQLCFRSSRTSLFTAHD